MNRTQLLSLESEAGFRALFEYATVGILVISREGRIELANPTIEKIFGYQTGELIGRPVEILIPEAFQKKHIGHRTRYFERPVARPMGYGLNLFARRKNGVEFPVEISLGHYELDNERLAVAFITDITVRAASEEKYRNLFENSLVAMFITDMATQNVIDVNEMGVQLFGYQSKEDFLENFKPATHFVHADERENTIQAIRDSGENKLTKEQEMRRLDGTHFWAKIFIKINHEKSTAQTVALDITEIKRVHERLEAAVEERTIELMQALEREKELNELKSRFVSMASHEFRTPLSAILTSASLIDNYNKEDQAEKRKKHTERIKASTSNLVNILNDFLSVDKLEQGKIEVLKEVFDLQAFSHEMIDEVNGLLKPGQQINFDHLGEKQILMDKKILRSVVLNLLTNAIKYSEEHKLIHFLIEVQKNNVAIRVKDEGMGIPEEDQQHLFSKFFRAKNVTNIQGTGLGLNIVKRY
ncbi:MAG TPA: PAS domain-containing sensor histidine kinase, partial [Cyclobacteriaceae bacterium]|nr:PAS domain-containing sensor histidine kinase [Cyclobacteriaceae bacterium]